MRTLPNSRRTLARLATAAAVVCLSMAAGCKSFLDVSALPRNEGDRLVVPILRSVDPIDEAEADFAGAEDVKANDLKAFAVDYVLSRNDLVQVTVMDLLGQGGVENVRTARVSETGMLTLPLLNEPVMASGLTEQLLQKAIASKYREAGLLQNAQVTVQVVEARGKTFNVLGSIARPGQYSILDSDFRVLNALVQAGDVPVTNVDYLYIVRKRISEQPSVPATQSTDTTRPATDTGPAQDLLKPAPGGDPLAPKPDVLVPPPTPKSDAPKPDLLVPPPTPKPDAPKSDQPGTDTPKKDETKAPGAAALFAGPLLAMDADPAPAAPAKADAPSPPPANADDRYIIIDGKPVPIGPNNQPVNPPATAPAELPAASGAVPVTQPAYEFGKALKADEDTRVIRVPLQQLRTGDLRYNVVIRPGDMIIVPPPTTGIYYMGGYVGSPGAYGLNGQKITLMQAVISARMLDPYAVPYKTDIIRRIGDNELFVRVNLSRIFEGKDPDLYLKPNDMVTVGTDFYPPFLIALRTAFRISYGFGFIYDRNYAPQQKLAK